MAKEPLKTNGAVKEEPVVETPKRPATKGTSGPPVYYPPNHDMFTKKDAPILVHTIFRLERCIVSLSFNFVFSRELWKGNRKAKLQPKRPRLKEERAERTVALPSSQSVCPFAAPCLVSSCKSSLSLSLCPTTNF